MTESRYLKLTGNYYFDPIRKEILKKQGTAFTLVLHDRRRFNQPVGKDRRSRFESLPIHLKPMSQGLFWDEENQNVYRNIRGNFVLYSRDRRKVLSGSPTGQNRRNQAKKVK